MTLHSLMILEGESRAALGIVRSLGQAGIPIMVGGSWKFGRSQFSRYIKKCFVYPKPEEGLEVSHAAIIGKVRLWRPDILMPTDDEGWAVIYPNQEEYSRLTTIVPTPNKELFDAVIDKGCLAEYAEQYGVPIPEIFRPRSYEEALDLCDQLPYPVLLKSRRSWGGIGIRKVNNADELPEGLKEFIDLPIIQEYIEGEDLELTILCNHGNPIAGSVYKSLRNFPLPYGPPIACRTISNGSLLQTGLEFLKKLNYHGVAHLDFRVDRRDGKAKLLDFNPRIAGTNDISIRSGVDFAFMLYKLASGEQIQPCFNYKVGLEFRWLTGELRHLLQAKNKLRTIGDLLHWRHVVTDFPLSDPVPNIIILFNLLRDLVQN